MVLSLYFRCHYAFLLGNLADASMYLDMLREEFKSGVGGLKPHQMAELAKVREAVRTGNVARNVWSDPTGGFSPPDERPDVGQDELVRRLHESGRMPAMLGDVRLVNVEQPCPPYGRVDMLYRDSDTVYPVEVKVGRGNHDLLGQIGKYDLYHRLRLHLGLYEFVKSVTICHAYDDYALAGLMGMGVLPLTYSPDTLDVRKA